MGINYERFENGVLAEAYDTRTYEDKVRALHARRNAERGTWQEQWEFFIDNGYSALVARDNNINARHPKPRKK